MSIELIEKADTHGFVQSRLEFGYGRWFGMAVNLAIVEYIFFSERRSAARVISAQARFKL